MSLTRQSASEQYEDQQMSYHQNDGDERLPSTTGETNDGFAGYTDDIAGSSRIIQGDVLKFGNDGVWSNRSADEPFGPERELVMVEIARVSQKWLNSTPVETRFVPPGEPMPDIDGLNAACPRAEWSKDLNGNPRGLAKSDGRVFARP
jgi:hypothetical protein